METVQVGQVGLNMADAPDQTLTPDANASAYPAFYDAVSKYGGAQQEAVPFEEWIKNPAAYNVAPVQSIFGATNTIDGPNAALAYNTNDIMGHKVKQPTTASLRGWTYDPKFRGQAVPFSYNNTALATPTGLTGLESFTKPEPTKSQYPLGNFGSTTPSILAGATMIPKYTQDQLNRQQYQQYTAAINSNNQMSRSNALGNWLKSGNPQIETWQFRRYWNDEKGNQGVHNKLPVYAGQNSADLWLGGTSKEDWAEKYPGLELSGANAGGGIGQGFTGNTTQGLQTGPQANDSLGNMFGGQKLDGAAPNLGEWTGGGFSGAFSGSVDGAGADGFFRKDNRGGLAAPMNGPGYAMGGEIGMPPGGGLAQPQGPQQEQNPQNAQGMINYAVSDMLQRNPAVGQQIRQAIDQAFSSGEVTPQQAHLVVQMAQACLNNPALWPQLKAWAEQQGLAAPGDLPEQFDKGLVNLILVVARTYDVTGQGNPQQPGGPQGQPQGQGFNQGGLLMGPGTGTSDSIQAVNTSNGGPVRVSNGEYVIPAHVVKAKGTEFFDSLINKYQPEGQA